MASTDVDTLAVLSMFEEHGFVSKEDRDGEFSARWALSDMGMVDLRMHTRIEAPKQILKPREDMPIMEQTDLELLTTLEIEGWEWKPMPSRRPPAYSVGSELVWYTNKAVLSVATNYLRSLLLASKEGRLLCGKSIEHGRLCCCHAFF